MKKITVIFWIILILAIALRGYNYIHTMNQTIWWDEADYMGAAKAYAGIGFADLSGQRLPGFPLLASLFMGMSEPLARFFLCFIPSIIAIILMYLAVKKMYPDKRIALIAMAIFAFLFESLFYSNRFQTENFGLIFQCLSLIFLFWAARKPRIIMIILAMGFAGLSVFMRPGQMLFIPAMILMLFISLYSSNKRAAGFIIAGVVLCFSVLMMASSQFSYMVGSYIHTSDPIAWDSLGIFSGLLSPYLDILFYIGFAVCVISALRWKGNGNENAEGLSDRFNILLVVSVLFAFIFIIRAPAYELRWFFPMLPAVLAITGKGIVRLADGIGSLMRNPKIQAVASAGFIIAVLFLSLSSQVINANAVIEYKKDSYADVKSAALWMKENSAIDDIIFSISKPQTAYYSERRAMSYSLLNNSEQFEQFLKENDPRWMTVSIYEPHPVWIYPWILENMKEGNETIYPAAAWFSDKGSNQPTLIVYGFLKDVTPEKSCEIQEDSEVCSF